MNLIMVGVDRSDTARRAAQAAAELAAKLDATLHLVTCVKKSNVDRSASVAENATDQEFLDALTTDLPHTRITSVIATGNPAEVICEEAQRLGAQMIVIGSKRTQGAARVLGSVALDVIRQSPCDVLVAHTNS